MIVGVDPGTTVGYAVFDLETKKLSVGSKREMSREELVDLISREGKPSLLACDVNPAPEMLIKLASYFNVRVSTPERDMGEDEKSKLVGEMKFSNEHERDAAAAAIRAYRVYENKLRQIDRVVAERGIPEKANEVKHLVLNNTSLSDALLLIDVEREIQTPEVKSKEEARITLEKKNRQLRELLISNAELRKAVERLENENAELRERLRRLERGVFERLAREKEIRKRDAEIRRLREERVKKLEKKTVKKRLDVEEIVEEYRKRRKHL